jgi:hypothetical protein
VVVKGETLGAVSDVVWHPGDDGVGVTGGGRLIQPKAQYER